MSDQIRTRERPAAGAPKGGADADEQLYNAAVTPDDTEDEEPTTQLVRARPYSPPPVVAPPPVHRIKVEMKINGVGMSFSAESVDITPCSVCCLLADSAISVTLPMSEAVELTIRGETYKVAFVGGWHTFESRGLTVIVFPKNPIAEQQQS